VEGYQPTVTAEYAAVLRRWHESAYQRIRDEGGGRVTYLGREFDVPADVFPPAPMSRLLGRAVLADVRETDRVLDMGTGCGVNAILAASRAAEVVGVDINRHAVDCAVRNAAANGVSNRTTFLVSDVFAAVEGSFDLIISDPPFRWFAPRDLLEAAMADEDYRALTEFMAQASGRLRPGGRILIFFGTSGDLGYLHSLVDANGFACSTVASQELATRGTTVSYVTYRLTHGGAGAR
jgi:release factor glutamine methyltransferase